MITFTNWKPLVTRRGLNMPSSLPWCPLGLEQRLVSYFRLCNREDLKGDVSILSEQTTEKSTDSTKLPYFAILLFVLNLTDLRD